MKKIVIVLFAFAFVICSCATENSNKSDALIEKAAPTVIYDSDENLHDYRMSHISNCEYGKERSKKQLDREYQEHKKKDSIIRAYEVEREYFRSVAEKY